MSMHKSFVFALFAGLATLVLTAPRLVYAEATSCAAASCSTSARVDFEVVIPTFLRLRIGSAAAAIDNVSFQPAAAVVGDSTPVSATSGGDVSPGVLTAQVVGNGGDVALNTALTNPASGLDDGGGNFIAWDEIDTADGGTMTAPTLQNGGVATVTYTAAANGVVNLSDTWTYTYANTTVPGAGTYTGRATYTASLP